MIKTSQFIWLKLNSQYFANIFIEIKELLGSNENNILELQNPLSLHITVYYLPANIPDNELYTIKEAILKLSPTKIKLTLSGISYFWKTIGHIGYKDFEKLENINQMFKSKFPTYNTIIDNAYPTYIPHTTLFKIKDYSKFLLYKKDIEDIITKNIEYIKTKDFIDTLHLYAVNSTFSPELQIITD